MSSQHSPRPTRRHAAEVNSFAEVIDLDESTEPIGYRWLQATIATKAVQPGYSTFVSAKVNPSTRHHSSHIVLQLESIACPPQTVFEHLIWAIENEGWQFQILKMTLEICHKEVAEEMKRKEPRYQNKATYRRLWFLIEYWTDTRLRIPDCSPFEDPFLFLDPEVYVTGACWAMNPRQREVPLIHPADA